MKRLISRIVTLIVVDSLLVNLSIVLSLLLRFELNFDNIPMDYINNYIALWPLYTIITILIFGMFRLYNSLWQFAGMAEAIVIFLGVLTSTAVSWFVGTILGFGLPKSCGIIYCLLFSFMIAGSRFLYRIIRYGKHNSLLNLISKKSDYSRRIMVIGAGTAGNMLIRELSSGKSVADGKVVCAIDDDKSKLNQYLHGVKIVGARSDIPNAIKKYRVNEVIYAIPSNANAKAEILNICRKTGCILKTLPSVEQIINNEIKLDQIRNVGIEDLLGRDQVKIDLDSIADYVHDKVVLITGGGGSIGSELCRQIAILQPKRLVIFDIYENNAYEIQTELRRRFPLLDLVVLIGSVRDIDRLNYVFSCYKPDIVYHAAAHKHVPLMEASPNESIKNNVFGTLNTVVAASMNGTKRFVLISSDKAVNPTNIMGATKRICEMIVQLHNNKSETEFVAVRFGNVLGSNGSVVPLFKKQIADGGPVEVTHPEITRYFMTIPEAVSLVLQAGAYAKGGEIFVLDMGKPVRILDVAENLIRLSGYTPYADIDISFTGLRPGEKLFEELLMDEEGLQNTENNLIHIGKPIIFDETTFSKVLDEMYNHMSDESYDIRKLVAEIVPTYIIEKDNTLVENEANEHTDKQKNTEYGGQQGDYDFIIA